MSDSPDVKGLAIVDKFLNQSVGDGIKGKVAKIRDGISERRRSRNEGKSLDDLLKKDARGSAREYRKGIRREKLADFVGRGTKVIDRLRQTTPQERRADRVARREVKNNPEAISKITELEQALGVSLRKYEKQFNDPKDLAGMGREVLTRDHSGALDFLGQYGYQGKVGPVEAMGQDFYISFDEAGNPEFKFS